MTSSSSLASVSSAGRTSKTLAVAADVDTSTFNFLATGAVVVLVEAEAPVADGARDDTCNIHKTIIYIIFLLAQIVQNIIRHRGKNCLTFKKNFYLYS
jgi:hypothetical protein